MRAAAQTMPLVITKPTFASSKVAALINMNPFEKVFDVVYDVMARHDVPLGTLDMAGYRLDSGKIHLAEKQALERHLAALVEPHLTPQTTPRELNALQQQLGILGPIGQQAAGYANMRYGQLQERRAVDVLKTQGRYGKGQQKTVEFNDFYLTGKTDGSFNEVILEIKNRTRRFLGVTDYERPQFECYMRLFNSQQLYLCERLGAEERKILLFANDELWDVILDRLTWVAQFIKEVQEQPYLQALSRDNLEVQFHQYIAERQSISISDTSVIPP